VESTAYEGDIMKEGRHLRYATHIAVSRITR